jgi:MSHA biogenesis protein MshQ
VHNNLRWNEVGSLTLRARLGGDDYLGAGDLVVAVPSGTVGRFYPEQFVLSTSSVSDACSGFSYMGQPFNLSYRFEARNQQGAVTSNYRAPGYANRASPIAEVENANNGIDLGARLQLPATDWALGSLELNTTSAVFNRQLTTLPDGPFNNLQLGIRLAGDGDNRTLAARDMSAGTTGICVGNSCTAATLGSARVLRFGRLRLDDAFGPESVNLPVKFATEFWSGSFFAPAVTDSCTRIPRTAITYPAGSIVTDSNRTVVLNGGSTQGIYGNLQPTEVVFSAGNAGHHFLAPGAPAVCRRYP